MTGDGTESRVSLGVAPCRAKFKGAAVPVVFCPWTQLRVRLRWVVKVVVAV